VEYESEIEEEEEDVEPIIDQGEIQSRNVHREELITQQEDILEPNDQSLFRGLRDTPVTNWADEVIDFYSQNTGNFEIPESPHTANMDDELFESDQESEASTIKHKEMPPLVIRTDNIPSNESAQESMQASLINNFDSDLISTTGSNIKSSMEIDLIGDAFADIGDLMGDDFDFDFDESSSDPLQEHRQPNEAPINNLEELNELFAGNITKEYKNIIDQKDQTIASIATGFTINPALENSRSVTDFLVKWLKGPGTVRADSLKVLNFHNIAEITKIYIGMRELTGTTDNNILYAACGDYELNLPIELTALVLINERYV